MISPSSPTPDSPEPLQRRVQGRGLGAFIAGATYPFRAIAVLQQYPQLQRYIVMPIVVNVVVGITIYAGLLFAGLRAIDAIIASVPTWTAQTPHWAIHLPQWSMQLPHWLPSLPTWSVSFPDVQLPQWSIPVPDWLSSLLSWRPTLPDWVANLPTWGAMLLIWLLRVLLTLILLVLTGFIFLQFGVLLGSPWYGKLSEELEKIRTGQFVLIEVGIAQDIGRAVLYELKKLALSLGIGIPLLVMGLIPGLGTLPATIGGLMLGATLVCLDFLDSPLERRRLRFRDKLTILRRSLPASASFAFVCLGLVSLPLVNLLAIPLCVTAGTLFVCDRVLMELPKP